MRTRLRFLLAFASSLLLSLSGCFNVTEPACSLRCSPHKECPDDFYCDVADGICHLKGSPEGGVCPTGALDRAFLADAAPVDAPVADGSAPDVAMPDAAPDAPMADLVIGADIEVSPDLLASPDLLVLPDLAESSDLLLLPDLTTSDLAMPDLTPGDMTVLADLTVVDDLTAADDLAMPDLALPDLLVVPDMTCVSSACTSPPPNTCTNNVATIYASPGSCDVGGSCVYSSSPTTCPNGCFQGACNTSGPSFAGDATATSTGGSVTLDKVANLNTPSGSAPAGASVVVHVGVTPPRSLKSLTLVYTTDEFSSTTPVTATVASTAGGTDTYQATIPQQVAGTTVRFYLDALQWDGSHLYNPGNNVNYTYVTQ